MLLFLIGFEPYFTYTEQAVAIKYAKLRCCATIAWWYPKQAQAAL